MENRFKKMIQPLLDEARREGYKAGPDIADPNIMELCFHNGERHMKEKVITMMQDILDQEDGLCLIDLSEVIKAVEDL